MTLGEWVSYEFRGGGIDSLTRLVVGRLEVDGGVERLVVFRTSPLVPRMRKGGRQRSPL